MDKKIKNFKRLGFICLVIVAVLCFVIFFVKYSEKAKENAELEARHEEIRNEYEWPYADPFDENIRTFTEGMLRRSNGSEEELEKSITEALRKRADYGPDGDYISAYHTLRPLDYFKSYDEIDIKFYDDFDSMFEAFMNGDIEQMQVNNYTYDYLTNIIDGFDTMVKKQEVQRVINGSQYYAFLVKWDSDLKDELNDVIAEMKDEKLIGDEYQKINENNERVPISIPTLVEKYVVNCGDMSSFDNEIIDYGYGNELIMGLTGDIPPIDYIDDDGNPRGFNVALINELQQRLHRDIKVVDIKYGDRTEAIANGKCDVVFCTVWLHENTIIPTIIGPGKTLQTYSRKHGAHGYDIPEGCTYTDYYIEVHSRKIGYKYKTVNDNE